MGNGETNFSPLCLPDKVLPVAEQGFFGELPDGTDFSLVIR